MITQIKKNGLENVRSIHTLSEVEIYLRNSVQTDEVIVLMGAGDVFRVGENLIKV